VDLHNYVVVLMLYSEYILKNIYMDTSHYSQ